MHHVYDREYPPGEWEADDLAASIRENDGSGPVPSYDDADVWTDIRSDPLTRPVVERIRSEANEAQGEPVPSLSPSHSLEWVEAGTRSYLDVERTRQQRLATFVLAECFEREGRYLPDILDYAWAECERASWVYPVNLDESETHEGLPRDAPPEDRFVDLNSSRRAKSLAEVDYLLGDRLHPELCERIRMAVDERVFRPYEVRDDYWWLAAGTNNWSAACNGNTLIAATYLVDDADRLASMLEKGIASLGNYLNGFDADGCTAEGIGYWNYGFGHFTQLAAQLEALTDGEYSLLSPPIVEEIVQFPLRVELSHDRFPAFSDATEAAHLEPFVACWLGERLDDHGLGARGRLAFVEHEPLGNLPQTIRNLAWVRRVPVEWERRIPSRREYFSGNEWWIVRADPDDPDAPSVAAKGGHNDESHNHNDCGSFVYHFHRESLLTDLGAPNYEQYFEGDYVTLPGRSLGHSVPYVNGCEQEAGEEYAATVVDRSGDEAHERFALDLAGCYPADAGLDALERTFAFDRTEGGRLAVTDEATFDADASGTDFQSVLISYANVEADGDVLRVAGRRGWVTVRVTAGSVASVERLSGELDKRGKDAPEGEYPDVWRARIAADEDRAGTASTQYVVEPGGR